MVVYERLSCACVSCALDCSTAAALCSYWPVAVIQILLRERVLLDQRLSAVKVLLCHRHRRLLPLQRGFGPVDLRLERCLIHQEEHLSFLHHTAFGVDALVQKAVDARLNVDLPRALRLRYKFHEHGRIARGDGDEGDVTGAFGGRSWRLVACVQREGSCD